MGIQYRKAAKPLRIAILDADTPVPNVLAVRGLYSDIFAKLLSTAAIHLPSFAQIELEFSSYHTVLGEFPTPDELQNLDGIIVTGSSASAYDVDPWVIRLSYFLKETYIQYPDIRLFGSCFGHQILAHALFPPLPNQSSVVCRDPAGWEIGIHATTLSPSFEQHFGPVTSNASSPHEMRLQFVHADHVAVPCLPEGFLSIGASEHCALQGFWQPGRVLTYQGHAEFDTFVNSETVKVFGTLAGWDEERLQKEEAATRGVDDSLWAAGAMLRFFEEERVRLEDREGEVQIRL